ncbi:MAG TPA: HAD family phosphatase [Solirubrobacteraceae bacterium]
MASPARRETILDVPMPPLPPPAEPHPIDTVVFDIGGVLLEWDPRNLYRKLFDDEAEMERFLSEVCTSEWHAAHDRGVPALKSCAELAAAHPEQAELIFAWARRTEEMVAGPIQGTVEILRELRQAGVACYALTNMEAETYPLRLARYQFLSWFDGTVVSSSEGVVKPDVEIFRRLLDRFGLDPRMTVMIDDSAQNLEAAASLGMTPIEFRAPEQLRDHLEQLALLPRAMS